MKRPLFCILSLVFLYSFLLYSCDAIVEPSIAKKLIKAEAPSDGYISTSYTVNFWWDAVEHALTYHLQVVTPSFSSPGSLVLDTIVNKSTFSFNLNPGTYQWRILAQNGSTETAYTNPTSFTVVPSSIKQQNVQLAAPANNYLTNQNKILFQWGNLYGATEYRFELDTNNFMDETNLVVNQVIPGQQINFSFSKDQVYQWRVRAENDTAQSRWSSINLITYDHTPPAQVIATSPANNLTTQTPVALTWNSVNGASQYKLYVLKSDSTTLLNTTFPLLTSSTSYNFQLGNSTDRIYWKVSAIDAAGNEGQASILRSFVIQ